MDEPQPTYGNNEQFVGIAKSQQSKMKPIIIIAVIFLLLLFAGIGILSSQFGSKIVRKAQVSTLPAKSTLPKVATDAAKYMLPMPIASDSAFVVSVTPQYVFHAAITKIYVSTNSAELHTNIKAPIIPRIIVTADTQIIIKNSSSSAKTPGKLTDLQPGETIWATSYINPLDYRWTTIQVLAFPK